MRNFIGNPSELGPAIRERRRALGLPQQELATRVGVTRQWIIEIEHGKSGAPIGLVFRTLSALGLSLSLEEKSERIDAEAGIDLDAVIQRARKVR